MPCKATSFDGVVVVVLHATALEFIFTVLRLLVFVQHTLGLFNDFMVHVLLSFSLKHVCLTVAWLFCSLNFPSAYKHSSPKYLNLPTTDAAQLAVEDDDDNDNDAKGPAPRMIDTDATDAMVEAWDCDVPVGTTLLAEPGFYAIACAQPPCHEGVAVSCDAQLLRTGDARKVFWEGTCLTFALSLVRAAGPPEEEGERACIAAWARFVGKAWHVPGSSAADLAVEGKEPCEPQLHVLLRSFVFVGGGAEELPAAVYGFTEYDGDASYVYSKQTKHEYDWTVHPDDPKEWLREDWPEKEKDEEEKEGSANTTTTINDNCLRNPSEEGTKDEEDADTNTTRHMYNENYWSSVPTTFEVKDNNFDWSRIPFGGKKKKITASQSDKDEDQTIANQKKELWEEEEHVNYGDGTTATTTDTSDNNNGDW
ncbi:hypothetical protein DFH27DRAFT_616806 [Peziza echinospora]|nr:hypothetical protein DFH27DRAFT_616806 [Peziza echinospora]